VSLAVHELRASYAFIERNMNLVKRYWGWEVVYNKRGAQYGDMVSFQLTFDLPWQRDERQRPQIAAKRKEMERIDAEREDTLRRHREEVEAQLAELRALDAQQSRLANAGQLRALDAQQSRLANAGQPLAAERVALALASYQAGRADLGAVLAARREAVDTRLRLIDLDAQRAALRVRLTSLIAE
jgi:outer membrane protein TolC